MTDRIFLPHEGLTEDNCPPHLLRFHWGVPFDPNDISPMQGARGYVLLRDFPRAAYVARYGDPADPDKVWADRDLEHSKRHPAFGGSFRSIRKSPPPDLIRLSKALKGSRSSTPKV